MIIAIPATAVRAAADLATVDRENGKNEVEVTTQRSHRE